MSVYSSHQKSHSRATKKFSEVFQSHSVLMHRLLTPPPSAHTAFRQPTPGVHFSEQNRQPFLEELPFRRLRTRERKVKGREGLLMSPRTYVPSAAPTLRPAWHCGGEAAAAPASRWRRAPLARSAQSLAAPGLRRKQAAPSRPASRRRPPRSDVRRLGARDIYGQERLWLFP